MYRCLFYVFFVKNKTAYDVRISDCSSDVCSSDLDDPGERRGAIAVAREADRDADRKEDAEVVEDRRARRRDEGDVEQVGLADAQQQTRDRQHRDRQHQRAAERLERFENLPHYRVSSNARASARTSAADLHCRASSACARASTSDRARKTT